MWVCNLVCHVKTTAYKQNVREYSVEERERKKEEIGEESIMKSFMNLCLSK